MPSGNLLDLLGPSSSVRDTISAADVKEDVEEVDKSTGDKEVDIKVAKDQYIRVANC